MVVGEAEDSRPLVAVAAGEKRVVLAAMAEAGDRLLPVEVAEVDKPEAEDVVLLEVEDKLRLVVMAEAHTLLPAEVGKL